MEHKTQMLSGIAHFDGLSKSIRIRTRQRRAGQFPTTGRPHKSPTGAKASGHTVEVRSKGRRVVWRKMVGKEHQALGGRDGKMVGEHQIESSSA